MGEGNDFFARLSVRLPDEIEYFENVFCKIDCRLETSVLCRQYVCFKCEWIDVSAI